MQERFVSGARLSGRPGAAWLVLALLCGGLCFSACETEAGSDNPPLGGPAKVQITARDKALVLQWTKVSPAQGVAPKYEVSYDTDANPAGAALWETVTAGESRFVTSTIDGLANGTTYYAWVRAVYEGIGTSDFSPTSYGMPIPPPATPGAVTLYPGEEMLELAWDPVLHAFTYEVYCQENGSGNEPPEASAETMRTVSEPGIALSGLANDHSYTVWVRAVNTAGSSRGYAKTAGAPTAASSAPAEAPERPEAGAGEGKLMLSWPQVHGVPWYKLYYHTEDTFAEAREWPSRIPASAPAVGAEITGLDNGTAWYVWVRSCNSLGDGAVSPSAKGIPQAKPPIELDKLQFELGKAAAEYIFAQDVPASVFFPEGRPNTDRLTRVQETSLGNLFADGMAWYVREKLHEPIDFVFLNGGYIDNGIPEGTITAGSLSGIVSSRSDKIFLLTMTGADLKLLFDDVADVVHMGRGGSGTGNFGIVSKEVRYTIQYYKPPAGTTPLSDEEVEPYYHGFIKPGTLKINGADIVDAQTYRICTTDYNASGVYFVRLNSQGRDKKLIDTPFWHGVGAYIYDRGTVTPYLDGRIKLEGGVPLPPPWVPGDLAQP
jgi:hypothetical protein